MYFCCVIYKGQKESEANGCVKVLCACEGWISMAADGEGGDFMLFDSQLVQVVLYFPRLKRKEKKKKENPDRIWII